MAEIVDTDILSITNHAKFSQEQDLGSKTTSFNVDFTTSQNQKVTLTANTMIITFSVGSLGVGHYQLKVVNGGLATITWAASSGSVYRYGTITLESSGTNLIACYFDGTDMNLMASPKRESA